MYVGNISFLLLIPKGTLQKYMFISRANIFYSKVGSEHLQ